MAENLKIFVRETGLYKIDAAELQRAGFPADALESGRVRLTEAGAETPYYLDDGGILFYGLASTDRYTADRVYILTAGQTGRQMASESLTAGGQEVSTVRQSVRLEENREYVSEAVAAGDGFAPWFWLNYGFAPNEAITFELANVGSGAGQLRAQFYGSSHSPVEDPDHRLLLRVNDAPDAEISWEGQTLHTATLELPPNTLVRGSNTITINSGQQEFLDISKLDWIEIEYESEPRATGGYIAFSSAAGNIALRGFKEKPYLLDVSDPRAPVMLEGWSYDSDTVQATLNRPGEFVAAADGFLSPVKLTPLQTSDLDDVQQQADLLIVTTSALAAGLDALVEAREAQGLTVQVAVVEEIYDTFGHGAPTPDSINQFVRFAYKEWRSPAPRYLLLVGDATIDYWGYLSDHPEKPVSPPENAVPSYLVPVSFGGETVSDVRLGDVEGDVRPELAVGRWPVTSMAEVRNLVQRTLAYEQTPAPARALFAVDDSSREFERVTEAIVRRSGLPQDRSELLVGVNASELAASLRNGAWLLSYVGHGSLQLWSREGMLSTDAIDALFAPGSAPLLLQLTCLTGLFAHPEITSLSEVMINDSNGPPLVVAATSLTLSINQEPFAVGLLEAIQSAEVQRIGDALQLAKRSLDVERIGLREISDTFILLGDPSALIARP